MPPTVLRAPAPPKSFHVALVEPEIPPNTGAIARTCVATRSPLHLIGPLGFRIDAHAVRRAGLDYWPHLDLHRHEDFEGFRAQHPEARMHLFSSKAKRSYLDTRFEAGDILVFGKESVGLPDELLETYADQCLAIPTLGPVRSLNLSNAVAIVLYEALRQCDLLSQTYLEEAERPKG